MVLMVVMVVLEVVVEKMHHLEGQETPLPLVLLKEIMVVLVFQYLQVEDQEAVVEQPKQG
tara:strand:- start:226 stop:405 length:180 start_codon:yes stop_codon:yes gene_type:complete